MRILKVRMGKEDRQILVDVFKNHKRHSLYTLTVKVNDQFKRRECWECVCNNPKYCGMCNTLEGNETIVEFIKKEFGIDRSVLGLTPIEKCTPSEKG